MASCILHNIGLLTRGDDSDEDFSSESEDPESESELDTDSDTVPDEERENDDDNRRQNLRDMRQHLFNEMFNEENDEWKKKMLELIENIEYEYKYKV